MPSDNLKDKTAKGFFWGMLNNGTMQVLNLVFGIILGRLLSPEDFGVTGVLVIFTTLAVQLQTGGFINGLANLKEATHRDYNAVFWFNVIVSLVCYCILFCCAPLLARFFHDPRLVLVSRVTFLSFVIASLGVSLSAYLFRNLMVRETAMCTILALLSSGIVGVAMALAGCAYWSIVGQQITYITVCNIVRMHYASFRPSWHIDLRPIKPMFWFSMKILIPNVITSLSQNLLTFFFGRFYPMHAVGLFNQANNWNNKAYSVVSGMVSQVAQPVVASVADDAERQTRVFRKMTRFAAFISFPLMFGIIIVARELIICTVSAKWIESVPLLQMLCVGGAFMPFYSLYQGLVLGRGKSGIFMWCNIAQIALQIALLFVLRPYGISVMVAATSAFNALYLLVWFVTLRIKFQMSIIDSLTDILPFALISAVVMGAVWWLTGLVSLPALPLLLLRFVGGAGAYIAVMKLLRVKMLDDCMAFAKKKLKRN